ncbi:hypothetical protein GAMM_330003 [Gammaproteobacteria bacterium]
MAEDYIELGDIKKNKREQQYNNMRTKLKDKLVTAGARIKTAGTFVLQKTKEANNRYQAAQSKSQPRRKGNNVSFLGTGLFSMNKKR